MKEKLFEIVGQTNAGVFVHGSAGAFLQSIQEGKMMEEDKTLEQRSRDWWRGVHAAELDEPYNPDETEAWKEGYKHGVYCPSGGARQQ